jgi:uncharacterized membrane protein required for colicin V production
MIHLFAAATAPAPASAPLGGELPLNAFDAVVIVLAIVGILRGRSRGISQDLLDLLMWVGIAIGGAFAYKPGGAWLAGVAHISPFWSRVGVYLGVMVLCFVAKVILKDLLKDKLANSDLFGSAEYPMGMLSGLVRFLLMIVTACALIHADLVSKERRDAQRKQQVADLGQSFFPSFGEIQEGIFENSFSGKNAKKYAPWLFIEGGGNGPAKEVRGEDSVGKRREKEIEGLTK